MGNPIPKHIGIIIDGNRRWAKTQRLSTFDGHLKGIGKIRHVAGWCFEKGIKIVSFYAFSTENWNRSRQEVEYLMNIIFKENLFENNLEFFQRKEYKILFSGKIERLPSKLKQAIEKAVHLTRKNKKGTINFCLNYGGRAEIVNMAKNLIRQKIPAEKISEKTVAKFLYNPDLPDPDLILRTGGEQRLSNFMLWEIAYSELFFLKKYWPDFSKKDLEKVLADYAKRQRRRGI